MDWYALLASGELHRVAAASASPVDFARRFGLSEGGARQQMSARGIPTFSELKWGSKTARGQHLSTRMPKPASLQDEWDDDQTNPGVPAFDVSDADPPHVDAAAYGHVNGVLPLLPDGHRYSGVSSLLDADGNVRLQWQKTNVSKEQYREALLKAVAEVAEPYRGSAVPSPEPDADADLLAVYCLGDPHLGMLAWGREAGADHDLDIAKRDLYAGVDHLVAEAPPADTALILSLGDLVHFDNEAGTTTAGTKQDADTRWFKVMIETVWTMRRCIDRALEKHRTVIGWMIRGNHDRHASAAIAIALAMFYESNPRVQIDLTPDPYSWLRFGKVLIGANHSDENSKPETLAAVMACDRAEDWGQTLYRYMLCGHLHHTYAKEHAGVLVERFPTLAPRDAWHHGKGYRAQQSMCVDVYHREWGRRSRRTVRIRQLRAA